MNDWTSGTVYECSEIAGSPQHSIQLRFSLILPAIIVGAEIASRALSKQQHKLWLFLKPRQHLILKEELGERTDIGGGLDVDGGCSGTGSDV